MPPVIPLPQYFAHDLAYPLAYTEAGTGPLLVLIHGSLCDYRYWRWQIPALSRQYRVVAPSLRGYWPDAFTTEDASFGVAQHARDLIAFINHHGNGEPAHILGHSRGAHIALELAASAPELTRSLILADPGFRMSGDTVSYPFYLEVVEKLEQGDVEGAMSQFVDTVNGPGTWRQMVAWFKAMVRDNANTLLSQINEIDLEFDMQRARPLDFPVLLVGGADSPERFRRRLNALEQILPKADRVTIPLASHGMNLANPKAFNERILDFLNR